MRINAINPVRVNSSNMNARKNNSIKSTVLQPATAPANAGNVAFKGGFGAVVGGLMGVVTGGLLTLVTAGAASAAVLPLIVAGAAIGYSEEEKTNKEEQNKKK